MNLSHPLVADHQAQALVLHRDHPKSHLGLFCTNVIDHLDFES